MDEERNEQTREKPCGHGRVTVGERTTTTTTRTTTKTTTRRTTTTTKTKTTTTTTTTTAITTKTTTTKKSYRIQLQDSNPLSATVIECSNHSATEASAQSERFLL